MPERTFKQKRAATSFAAKLRRKGQYASVLEEPVKPWGSTKRERAQKRYIVQYDSARGIMGNPNKISSVRKAKKYAKRRGASVAGFSAYGKVRGRARKAKSASRRTNPISIRGWVRAKAVKIVRDKKGRATSVKIKT